MIKKSFYVFIVFALFGCSTVSIPNYVQDKNPYKKIIYSPYDDVLMAVMQTIEDAGWTITSSKDPVIFEQSKIIDSNAKQTLLFTDTRSFPVVVGTRYAKLNAYIRFAAVNETEVELRYLTVNSVLFKSFNSYKHDMAVERMFKNVEKHLNP